MAGNVSCCGRWRVEPALCDPIRDHMIEIRPKRLLHIQHINPRPRNEQFQRELQTFLQYQKQGLSSVGPITLPKKQPVNLNKNMQKTLSAQDVQPCVPLANNQRLDLKSREQTPDSTYSWTEDRKTLISATGIDVAVPSPYPTEHNQLEKTNHITHNNNITELSTTKTPPLSSAQQNGKENSAVIFFIHGVGESSDIWRAQLNYFSNIGYEIVAPDLIGHGMSCAPKESRHYHFDQIAADLEEVFDTYCKRDNVVIGHSYGCSFAAVLARSRSKRVAKLIMISGGGPTPLAPQSGIFSLPVSILGCLRPCVECKYKKSAFSGLKPIMRPEEAFSVPTYVLSNVMNGQIWSDGDELYHNWIICPTLLIYGQQDKLISLNEEEEMREAIFNSELEIIPDASHMVMIEEPDKVNTLIYKFLQNGCRRESSNFMTHHVQERSKSRASIRSINSVKSIPNL